jgi:hypothetical protein
VLDAVAAVAVAAFGTVVLVENATKDPCYTPCENGVGIGVAILLLASIPAAMSYTGFQTASVCKRERSPSASESVAPAPPRPATGLFPQN